MTRRMPAMVRGLVAGVVSAAVLTGQSLRVPPSTTRSGTPGSFSLILDLANGKVPLALQWEFSIPAAIAVSLSDIALGTEAASARKSITCASKTGSGGAVRYACIVAGGQDPLRGGAIAVVQYRSKEDVQGAPIRVAIENVIGVSRDLQPISMPNVDAILRIQP